ncbi:GNAT family N-acetyltransferase [Roseovarius indicus]|uniref:GNAT family N-acetyltransferase n=3 Tax=Roseovarius indicus TaxID=540747 RepID=UPI0035164562
MSVRAAGPEDAGAIAEIWNPYIRETSVTFTTDEKTVAGLTVDIAARPGAFFVAEDDGAVLGFATAFPFRGGPGYRHTMEHTVQLAPDAAGRGLGRALMTRLEAALRESGAHVLVSGVSGENTVGIAFHHAIGFETVGRMPEVGRKFGRWMDLVLMQKIL